MKPYLISFCYSLLACLLLTACTPDAEKDMTAASLADQISKALQEKLNDVKPATEEARQAATEEISKLSSLEYHVAEFDRSRPAHELSAELNLLGKERWECFHIEQVDDKLLVFCLRLPKTYLRYIPRVF